MVASSRSFSGFLALFFSFGFSGYYLMALVLSCFFLLFFFYYLFLFSLLSGSLDSALEG